nr:hypothetical protein [Burkholderia cepacia]
MEGMKQTDLELNLPTKRTRKRAFPDEMNRAVPRADLDTARGHGGGRDANQRPEFDEECIGRVLPGNVPEQEREPAIFRHGSAIGVDAESALMYTVRRTSRHVSDVLEANRLLH